MKGSIHISPNNELIIRIPLMELQSTFGNIPDGYEGIGHLGIPNRMSEAFSLLRQVMDLVPMMMPQMMGPEAWQFPAEIVDYPSDLIRACSCVPKHIMVSVQKVPKPRIFSPLDILASPPVLRDSPSVSFGNITTKSYRYERIGDRWVFHGKFSNNDKNVHVLIGSEKSDKAYVGQARDAHGNAVSILIMGFSDVDVARERLLRDLHVEKLVPTTVKAVLHALDELK